MDDASNENMVKRLLRLADTAIERSEYGPAFVHLTILIEMVPNSKDSIKHKFISCLCMLYYYNY
jgi:hypothetical protein